MYYETGLGRAAPFALDPCGYLPRRGCVGVVPVQDALVYPCGVCESEADLCIFIYIHM